LSRPAWVIPAAAVLVAVLAVIAVSGDGGDSAGDGSEPGSAGSGGASLKELLAEPERFAGQAVTITGTVEERYADRSFSLGRRDSVPDVIVLTEGDAAEAAEGEWPSGAVTVTGEAGVVRAGDEDLEEVLGGDLAVRVGSAVVTATELEPAELDLASEPEV